MSYKWVFCKSGDLISNSAKGMGRSGTPSIYIILYGDNIKCEVLCQANIVGQQKPKKIIYIHPTSGGGAVAVWVRASTGDRTVDGSSPTSVKTFLFGTLTIPFTPLCQCISDETVQAVSTSRWSLLSGVYARGSKRSTSPHWNV